MIKIFKYWKASLLMKKLDIDPGDALPILDHGPAPYFEKMAKNGRWDEVPRSEVFEIPEGHILRRTFNANYVVFEGNKRRATAQKHRKKYRVGVLEECDIKNFRENLKQTLRNAEDYYGAGIYF